VKRPAKRRFACEGVTLVDVGERARVQLCRADATVIAQVTLPCAMKDLCDECLKRYRKLGIVTRVLVDLRTLGQRIKPKS